MNDEVFAGVKVVELAQWVFVPVAGATLADWGADVVRVERLEGDAYRGLATQGIGTERAGVNLSIALANRGKRSIAIDVQQAKGMAVLLELLEEADVFLTNLRPSALERLGLDAGTMRERFPHLVYGRGHGFGVRGPDADLPGYDSSAYFARGGLAHVLSPPDLDYPVTQRGAMGDRSGAMALAFGIAGALLRRYRTGEGSVVDVSLLATAMWTLSSDLLAALNGGEVSREATRGAFFNPLTSTYRTKDNRYVSLVFLQPDRHWADLCHALDRPDLAEDPRFADITVRAENCEACLAELDAEFGKRNFEECKALLSRIDAPWAPVQSVEELVEDPQVLANDYIGEVRVDSGESYVLPAVPVQFDEQPPPLRRAPEHGEHTEAVLLELGRSWDDIQTLKTAGVIP